MSDPRGLSCQAAIAFAKTYTQLVEALMREGVDEADAREEAHLAAIELLHIAGASDGEICQSCGAWRRSS